MSKNVLILAGSPRRGGNSDLLCDAFLRGAQDAGNAVEKIFLQDKRIGFCSACGVCYMERKPCVQDDDVAEIVDKMVAADVIVMSTPVYFYAMGGQMKTLIDRTIGRCMELRGKEFCFIIAAHANNEATVERVMTGFRGYLACLPECVERGIVFGGGVFGAGEIADKPTVTEAYDAGRGV